jgi:hypothetical protein
MNRFDYVAYDEISQIQQAMFKEKYEVLTSNIEELNQDRAALLALTKLEESYMWVGKAIRNNQLDRNSETKLEE